MARVREITPEVREVLEKSLVDGKVLYLPPVQLERKLYEAVNKTLTDLGGKWNRKAKGHLFPEDVKEMLAKALDDGGTVNQKQELQAFFTPDGLADMVVAHAEVEGQDVLEPSAGHGALADACRRASAASVLCVEMHEPFARVLLSKDYMVMVSDFLAVNPAPLYDRVVMNPPFTRDQDLDHVLHAIKFLRPGGRLVSVMAGNTTRTSFMTMMEILVGRGMEPRLCELPEGSFKSSGTGVRTVLLILDRPN